MNAPADTPESPPARIGGRYRLDEKIGSGAMGVVWRGTDELLNRQVAVKELLAAVPSGRQNGDPLEEASQRLMREGRLGARLRQHPHVIGVFDVVVHDERPWLVMEYLPSQSLATVLAQRGTLPPQEVAEVARQVADGLAAAHNVGVVHRDVKPGNVLLAEDGRVKLTDFGVSRAVDDVQVTRTGLIAGTPAFLAPEVARGREPTAASDVFALGATIYAAVEGHPPFGLDDNAYALLHKVAMGVIEPPAQAGPLTNLLMRLLAPEPEQRPTAAQARDALAAVAAGAPPVLPSGTAVLAPPPAPVAAAAAPVGPMNPMNPPTIAAAPPAQRPRRPPGRTSPVLMVLLGALLVAIGAAAVLLVNRTGAETPIAAPPAASPTTSAAPTTTRPPATTTPAPVPADNPEDFVRDYYALLPGNPDAAWALLGPQAQAGSGGLAGYQRFWSGIENVDLDDVDQTGEGTVEATVVFDLQGGGETRERYRFVVDEVDGQPVMRSFSKLD
ncbi:serine/threonine-protein kinase [Pseudonocardia sp.]|uniref:serine/threonine-protein kinase n=1 Tax=Pseudonocardia sp. TaxID=60912 RepID=UPI003D09FCB2